MDKEKKLNYLRKEIIKEVCIDEWKDAWFYPEQDGVRGWLGTQNIMFVGSNPSYNIFPSKFTDFFYEQLKKNGFENAHLTDLVKIRAENKDADRIINKHFKKQIKFFEEEIKIINPKIIVIMGGRAQESLKKLDYNLKDFYPIYHYSSIPIYHYSSIRFPKNKKKFIKQLGHIKNIYVRGAKYRLPGIEEISKK